MSWEPLYITIEDDECIKNSLPKLNNNFLRIDDYISTLSLRFSNKYLIDINNLSDVPNKDLALTNLGFGTVAKKDQRLGAQAWVSFAEDATIISSYNVASVTHQTNGNATNVYKIVYTTPLEYVGPIMVTGGYNGPSGRNTDLIATAFIGTDFDKVESWHTMDYPSLTSCYVTTMDFDDQWNAGHLNEYSSSYVNVVMF